jgi:hypothetical protein
VRFSEAQVGFMFGRRRAHRSTSLGAVEDWLGAWTAALAALLTAANHLCLLAFGSPLLECQRLEYCTTVGGASEAQSLPSSRQHPSFAVRAKHQLGPYCRSRTAHCTAPELVVAPSLMSLCRVFGRGSKLTQLRIFDLPIGLSMLALCAPAAHRHRHQANPKNHQSVNQSIPITSPPIVPPRTPAPKTCFTVEPPKLRPAFSIASSLPMSVASLSCSRIN